MKIGAVIQARTSSTRFPKKVLKPLPYGSDVCVLQQDIRRVKKSKLLNEVIIATTYQTDTNRSQDTLRSNTVVVTDAERKETGLIKQVISPQYRGAVILCQGADNANVRLSIMDAVKSATGLTYDRITILKMK